MWLSYCSLKELRMLLLDKQQLYFATTKMTQPNLKTFKDQLVVPHNQLQKKSLNNRNNLLLLVRLNNNKLNHKLKQIQVIESLLVHQLKRLHKNKELSQQVFKEVDQIIEFLSMMSQIKERKLKLRLNLKPKHRLRHSLKLRWKCQMNLRIQS